MSQMPKPLRVPGGKEEHHEGIALRHGYVPVIDLGIDRPCDPARRAAVADAVRAACETSGFLVVVGHGVSENVVAALYRAAREFFTLPHEDKERVLSDPADPLQHGFLGNQRMELFSASLSGEGDAPGQLTGQGFELLSSRNRWPELPGFREAYLDYYSAVGKLSFEIMRLFALALDLPESWFDDKFDRHVSPLSVNYYPPQPEGGWSSSLRTDPHVDVGCLTVLYQDDAPGGLQVRDKTGQWLDVPPLAGSFVVNIGAMMTRWTNDRWASTMHRVVNPPEGQEHRDRISIALFYQANPETEISCIPTCAGTDNPPLHTPIRSGDYFLARVRRGYLNRRTGRSDALT